MRQVCRLLDVNRSWLYAAMQPPATAADTSLRAAIEAIVLEFAGYGYRRVTKELRRRGQREARKLSDTRLREGRARRNLDRARLSGPF